MRAGQLRHRLGIQTATEAISAAGSVTYTWATDATVWGSIEPLSGRELVEAQQTHADVSHRCRIRHYAGTLTPAQRIMFGTRVFNVSAVLNVQERNREMVIYCKEVVT